jgi:hypothetical protein
MNDTTVIGVPGTADDVRDYVGAVRAWLADLPADEVDDLTAGMEADLAERAAETGARLGDLLGQPEAYAAELRAAAGLPPRSTYSVTGGSRSSAVDDVAAAFRASGDRTLVRWPWLRDLRPVWWVVRGAVLGGAVAAVFGTGRFLVPLIGAAVSFWLGRTLASRSNGRGSGLGLALVNGVAVLALLPVGVWLLDSPTEYVDRGMMSGPGVVANGEPVRNLYVYDATGQRVEGARIFDATGQPLFVDPNTLVDGLTPDVPVRPDDGQPAVATDVFPLRWGTADAWQDPGFGWAPPLVIAPVAPDGAGAPTLAPSPGASASPAPSASPSSSASSSLEASPSPSASASPTP